MTGGRVKIPFRNNKKKAVAHVFRHYATALTGQLFHFLPDKYFSVAE